jgi:hypothetical protein
VTKSAGPGGVWLVPYEKVVSDNDTDVFCALVSDTGALLSSNVAIDDSAVDDTEPDAAGNGTEFLVVWQRLMAGNQHDIVGARLSASGALVNLSGSVNLSPMEPGVNAALDQIEPAADFDGCRFAYAYREGATGIGNFDVYAATLHATVPIAFQEGHVALATSSADELEVEIASDRGDTPGESFAVWTRASGADLDVQGARYSVLGAGGVQVVATGCGGSAEPLFGIDPPVIGTSFSALVLVKSGMPVIALGLPANVPLCPAQGGCVLGVSPITTIVSGNLLSLTIPCNPALVGKSVALQAAELLPIDGGGVGCAPPDFPIALRLSDTMRVALQ